MCEVEKLRRVTSMPQRTIPRCTAFGGRGSVVVGLQMGKDKSRRGREKASIGNGDAEEK
jgi:hypothetical protein